MESNSENITTFTDSIVFDTIKDLASRSEIGLAKYNMTMDREDLIASDWVQNAYEEALDMALYLKRLKKDMLAMEEELSAFKTQAMIRSKLVDEAVKNSTCTTTNSGTKLVYDFSPKPNEVNTGSNDSTVKRAWHF
jgi:hypothetical protein